ncbi:NAD(P)-binding protein [Penicillium longicatenatum]|uniref:NAD(P)-binding protein n=1 Tax=Penicillium longicatenatum TaxID=1561947 RepID=UPI00254793A2|nr:NAD(P)-binding protein [Penicillium longicatenatum]KAJ5631139.1 NAD(P)-binding protein [Penicillium longicatenatum]
MSTSNKKLVLLTGATGFIGFQTLLDALKAGFRVRCAVRSEAKGEALLSKPALQPLLQADNQARPVEVVVVPDQAAPGAFREAIVGVSYVIHIASPLPSTQPNGHLDAEANFLAPARRATLEMLEAAATTNSVERIVITSSVAAFVSPKIFMGLVRQDPQHPFTPTSRAPLMTPPFPHAGVAYVASKVASLEATETWVKETKPRFSVINIHPSWVMGRAECADDVGSLFNTTNRLVLNAIVKGEKSQYPVMMGAVVDVHDVARMQIQSLQKADIVQPGNCQSFIASTPGIYEDIPGIIRKNFAEQCQDGRVTVLGEQASFPLPIDSSSTEITFGWKFRTLEQMINDLISQYIELQ